MGGAADGDDGGTTDGDGGGTTDGDDGGTTDGDDGGVTDGDDGVIDGEDGDGEDGDGEGGDGVDDDGEDCGLASAPSSCGMPPLHSGVPAEDAAPGECSALRFFAALVRRGDCCRDTATGLAAAGLAAALAAASA